MYVGEGSFRGAGGLRIAYREWAPSTPRPPQAVVVVVHALYDHSARYESFASTLVQRGWRVWAYDQRGHGNSDGPPGVLDSFEAATADLREVVALARAGHGAPCFVVGHSVGGAVALGYAIEHQDELAGLVCTAPTVDRHAILSPLQFVVDRLFRSRPVARLSARARAFALDSSVISNDPTEVAAHRADPLIHHGPIPLRTATVLAQAIRGILAERLAELTLPMLIAHGDQDPIVAPATSVDLFDTISSEDKTLLQLPGMRHALYHELQPARTVFFEQLADWIDERSGGVPAR